LHFGQIKTQFTIKSNQLRNYGRVFWGFFEESVLKLFASLYGII